MGCKNYAILELNSQKYHQQFLVTFLYHHHNLEAWILGLLITWILHHSLQGRSEEWKEIAIHSGYSALGNVPWMAFLKALHDWYSKAHRDFSTKGPPSAFKTSCKLTWLTILHWRAPPSFFVPRARLMTLGHTYNRSMSMCIATVFFFQGWGTGLSTKTCCMERSLTFGKGFSLMKPWNLKNSFGTYNRCRQKLRMDPSRFWILGCK